MNFFHSLCRLFASYSFNTSCENGNIPRGMGTVLLALICLSKTTNGKIMGG